MFMLSLVEPHIFNLSPYVPGKTFQEVKEEFGLENIIKLASNENCFGPSLKAIEAMQKSLVDSHLYSNEKRKTVKRSICQYLNVKELNEKNIVLGNGSNELIGLLVRAFLAPHEILLNGWPSFLTYRIAAQAFNRAEKTVFLTPDFDYDLDAMIKIAQGKLKNKIKLVFVANPNNPTGRYLKKKDLKRFMKQLPEHVVVVIDEAYVEYVDEPDYATMVAMVLERERTVVLRTFSKIFGLAGLRIGFAVCSLEVADILRRVREPFNVNYLAQVAAIAALEDTAHIARSQKNNKKEIMTLAKGLKKLGVEVTESVGNFLMLHLPNDIPKAKQVIHELLKRGIIVRELESYNLPQSIRVTVGTPEQNQKFLVTLKEVII